MGARRKRLRREEEFEEEQGREPAQEAVQEEARAKEREATPAGRVLELQKTAGNRAAGAAIARWGFATLPLAAMPHWPKEPELILDGVVIPMSSFSWGGSRPPSNAGHASTEKENLGGEVTVTTPAGTQSADLFQKSLRSTPIQTAILVVPGKDGNGITVTLTEVLITRWQHSGDTDSWTLNFSKRELSQSPPLAQPRP